MGYARAMRAAIRLVTLTALAAATLLGASCGADGTSPTDAPQPIETRVIAASDLRFALDELLDTMFHAEHPECDVQVSYGSSGQAFAQLSEGAPFDLFLSADITYAERLVESGHALRGSVFAYARGRIVLWAKYDARLRLHDLGAAALSDERVHHIALANPEHAPYGRAAEASLRSLGLYDGLSSKLVLGANVGQAASLVESGSAEVGIIALSLAKAPSMRGGDAFEMPLSSYPALRQGGVVIPGRAGERCAQSLANFLQTERAAQVLGSWGFLAPARGH